ncbi:protein phosphatase 2C domain-containing protein [Leptolyngbya sp. GB1-A1]|uniref:protein phosphatase 2C domain-containing protein n=1 Tax=Leptolyngbya sp. GB1-A1 TaxID=2933908 RepID=UPI00329953A2
MLYCSNPICQTPNPETHRFCQKCRTPLIRRYLWAVGAMASAYRSGDVLSDRFLCKGSRIFLDSKPGLPPMSYGEVPEPLLPYLRLSSCQLHVPQIYDWLQFESETTHYTPENTLLLLDQAPIYRPDSIAEQSLSAASQFSLGGIDLPQSNQSDSEVLLFPSLPQMWQSATPFRQLHWLWQIAQLWQPLSEERCAATVLDSERLRVEGGLLRLLELQTSRSPSMLSQLGQSWLDWAATARSEIQGFLQQLCQQLIEGRIQNAEQLVDQLDWAIAQVVQSQTYQIQIATRTDQGPTRPRNEDACYPASGTEQSDVPLPLVIVCDGIGGHQGGDVASHLAIEAVAQRVLSLQVETLDSASLMVELEKAACLANDLISQRNDSEQRFDRQRMGTTIVMALVRKHELYIAHLGDSRAYWVTPWGCHQITVDDDIASREVRLGYSTYRQALQQPSAGALVQALGMVGSSMLYPTVQRFLLDEDSVFLLCSDGLCDNDRVEEIWDTEILPVLAGKLDLLTLTRNLIDIGNTRNGYDNVTVGLLSCQIVRRQPTAVLPFALSGESATSRSVERSSLVETGLSGTPTQVAAPVQLFPSPQTRPLAEPAAATAKTRIIPRKASSFRWLPWMLLISVLSGLAVTLYLVRQKQLSGSQAAVNRELLPAPSTSASIAPTSLDVNALLRILPAETDPTPTASPTATSSNALILQSRPAASTVPAPVPSLLPSPTASPTPLPVDPEVSPDNSSSQAAQSSSPDGVVGSIPAGSIVEVLSKQGATAQDQWVKLRVCSVPIVAPPTSSPTAESPSAASPPAEQSVVASQSPAGEIAAKIAPVQPGQEGWLREADLLPIVARDVPTDRASCPPLEPQASPSP